MNESELIVEAVAQENVQNFNNLEVVDIKEINHLKADGAMKATAGNFLLEQLRQGTTSHAVELARCKIEML